MKKSKSPLEAFIFLSSIGFHFVIVISLCLYIGRQIDTYFNSAPIGTVWGIVLGMITAIYTTYQKIKDINR